MHKEGDLPQEKEDLLKAVLSGLKASGIEASAVISRDGSLLASDVAPGEEHKIFAPMYAAMLGAAEEATSELRLGIPRHVIMEVGARKLIATGAGSKALVVALIGPKAAAGVMADIDRAAAEVKAVMAK